MRFVKPKSCLNIYNFLMAIALWALILWGGTCAYDAASSQEPTTVVVDTVGAWEDLFSQKGTFMVICDSVFIEDDSVHAMIHYFISTGDPDDVWKESYEYTMPVGKSINLEDIMQL
jgi:hypothetical protein